ncbi:hypothetical protein ACFL21_00800 [Patescibacteria group bacterium]
MKLNFKKLVLIAFISCSLFFGVKYLNNEQFFSSTNLFQYSEPLNYQEILATGVKPGISPNFDFPNSYQYKNGCVAFAVNHVLIYKYGEGLDLLEVEKTIQKPRDVLWSKEYVSAFIDEYDLEVEYFHDSEFLFKFLEAGEPITISYKYYLNDKEWVAHRVAAFSFDENGVWISDSLSGEHLNIPYEEVFKKNGKQLQFTMTTINKH